MVNLNIIKRQSPVYSGWYHSRMRTAGPREETAITVPRPLTARRVANPLLLFLIFYFYFYFFFPFSSPFDYTVAK